MAQDRRTGSNEFILLPREEFHQLLELLRRAEEVLTSRRELELDVRMTRMKLERKWQAAGNRPAHVNFPQTPAAGTKKDPRGE